jgi:hypothetical protein
VLSKCLTRFNIDYSKHEWIGVYDMEQSAAMLVALVQVWEERIGKKLQLPTPAPGTKD